MSLKDNEKKTLLAFFWSLIEMILSIGKDHISKRGNDMAQ